MAAYLVNVLLALAVYFGLQECPGCIRPLEATPELPVTLLIVAIASAGILATAVQWLHVRRKVRLQAASDVLEPVADEDIPFSAATLPSHPAAVMTATLLLLTLLGWAIAEELRGLARHDQARLPTDAAAAAATSAPPSSWPFLALDVALAIVVIACAAALVRRIVRNRAQNPALARRF